MPFPQRLVEGYRQFADGRLRHEQGRYRELAEAGQSPEVMVIGCCDSRVSPEVIFDARPGELFVVRNVANIVPPYEPDGHAHGVSAALEFGVARAEGQAHRRARACALRRREGFCRKRGAALARRLHRQLDAADGSGGGEGRPARQAILGGLHHPARAGERRQQPRQSQDLSAAARADRVRPDRDPRRLFRRGDGRPSAPG